MCNVELSLWNTTTFNGHEIDIEVKFYLHDDDNCHLYTLFYHLMTPDKNAPRVMGRGSCGSRVKDLMGPVMHSRGSLMGHKT